MEGPPYLFLGEAGLKQGGVKKMRKKMLDTWKFVPHNGSS
jgi:hypothetical protein